MIVSAEDIILSVKGSIQRCVCGFCYPGQYVWTKEKSNVDSDCLGGGIMSS